MLECTCPKAALQGLPYDPACVVHFPEKPKCRFASHSFPEGYEECFCIDKMLSQSVHEVHDDPATGPPFCVNCSKAIQEYVSWPCIGVCGCAGTGLISDETACGDRDHCSPAYPCPHHAFLLED